MRSWHSACKLTSRARTCVLKVSTDLALIAYLTHPRLRLLFNIGNNTDPIDRHRIDSTLLSTLAYSISLKIDNICGSLHSSKHGSDIPSPSNKKHVLDELFGRVRPLAVSDVVSY